MAKTSVKGRILGITREIPVENSRKNKRKQKRHHKKAPVAGLGDRGGNSSGTRYSSLAMDAGLMRVDVTLDAAGNGFEDLDEVFLILLQEGDAESLEIGSE